jgi:hypothetical protein
MTKLRRNGGHFSYLLCMFSTLVFTTAITIPAAAQTNAAAMAVRQRVEGLQNGPAGPEGQPQPTPPGPGPGPGSAPNAYAPGQPGGKLDTRFISPNAAVVIVLRPSQFMASPLGQVFPVEVASTAGQRYLGFDPAEMEEIIAFAEPSGQGGITFTFKNPIRASSIPPMLRANAQLADLNGKKYLRSNMPQMPSFYGPNNKTLVVANDAILQQLVTSAAQPRSGPTIDRLRDVPSGSDLYVSIDVAALKPMIQKAIGQLQVVGPLLAQQLKAQGSATSFDVNSLIENANAALPYLDILSAVEFTLNASTPGPTTAVAHCTDEAAAQKLETSIQEGIQKIRTPDPSAQTNPDNPVAQGIDRYRERLLQLIQPQRTGTTITCLHVDGQNPAQQQLVSAAIIAGVTKMQSEGTKAKSAKGKRAKAIQTPGGPAGPEGQPVAPEGQPVGPDGQPAGPEGQPAATPEAQPRR